MQIAMDNIQLLIALHLERSACTKDNLMKDHTKGCELTARIIINPTKFACLFVPFDDTLSFFIKNVAIIFVERLTKGFPHKFISKKVEDWFWLSYTILDKSVDIDTVKVIWWITRIKIEALQQLEDRFAAYFIAFGFLPSNS